MDKIKQGINNYITPILIAVIGWFIVQTLLQIKKDINTLYNRNVERDEWVQDWTEEWQPVLHWGKQKMEKESK